MKIIENLRRYSSELTDLHHVMALLQWDQEVKMPARATEERAGQMATLSGVIHRREVSLTLDELLKGAEDHLDELSEKDRALVRVMRRNYDRNTRLPEDFVTEFTHLTSRALASWSDARTRADFSLFQPLLGRIVEMSRKQAEYIGYAHEPYDALLDLHEEGFTAIRVAEMFSFLKAPLVNMVQECSNRNMKPLIFEEDFDLSRQVAFAERVLEKIGYDFERGRQDVSAHPFSTSIGHHDRRVTNRYNPRSVEFIFSALHEGGHALYEQGISDKLSNSALDEGISLGIHESQSRLWENIIGRSLPFWKNFYPELQNAFPGMFGKISVEAFVRGVNMVNPGFIRVEADEVTYNLHVMIRFELEKALMDGDLEVSGLPEAWNAKYQEYLGLEVESDAEGVLQDIHWAHGSLGYFPTYTIGNIASAQIWHMFTLAEPGHAEIIGSGELFRVRDWLAAKIYAHGSVYPPDELLKKVCGEPLNPSYFIDYLRGKYG